MNSAPLLTIGLELLAKSAGVLGTALLLSLILRRASAAVRHALWCAAFAALLLLPLTKAIPPRWSWQPEAAAPVKSSAPLIAAEPAALPAVIETAPRPDSRWQLPSPAAIAVIVWIAGALLLLGYRVVGSVQLLLLRRRSTTVQDARILARARLIASEMRLHRAAELRTSDEGRVPVTWGIWRSVLLLPSAAAGWSEAQLDAALRHELGHVARRDYLTRWLAQFACALYWPNPLVWLGVRALRQAQEEACDDLVLRAGAQAGDYAALLLEAARSLRAPAFCTADAVAMARPSTLESRLLAIVNERRDRRPLGGLGFALATAGATFALALCSGAQVAGADNAAAAPVPGRPIVIEAKFFEITRGSPGEAAVSRWLKGDGSNAQTIVEAAQAEQMVRELASAKGADLLSAPRVTTQPGQKAAIEMIREFQYPTTLTPDPNRPGHFKGSDLASRNLGITMEVKCQPAAAGSVAVEIHPQVTELAGFNDITRATDSLVSAEELDASLGKGAADSLAFFEKGRQPVFRTRSAKASATLPPGSLLLLGGLEGEDLLIGSGGELPKGAPTPKLTRQLYVLISARELAEPAAAAKAAPVGTAAEQAQRLIIPRLEFRDATVRECVTFLMNKSGALAPDKKAVNFVLNLPPGEPAKITLSLTNIPLLEAARYVANLAGLELRAEPEALVIGAPAAPAPPNAPSGVSAAPESPALAKAQKLIIPRMDLREATVGETLEFLRAKARDLDPEKTGVNLVIGAGMSADIRITLSLSNVPLSEALRYVAGLANLRLVAEPGALVLQRAAETPKPSAPDGQASASGANDVPIDITAGTTRFENGVVHAEDRAELKFGTMRVTSDTLTLSPDRREATFGGNVKIETEGKVITGRDLTLQYEGNRTFNPARAAADSAFVTKEWRISAESLRAMLGIDGDPNAVKAALNQRGIMFAPGSSVIWMPKTERLLMRDNGANIARVDALIEAAVRAESPR